MTDYDLQFGQSGKGCYISRNNAYVIRHEGRIWNVRDGHGALLAPDFPTLTAAKAWANNDQAVKLGYEDAERRQYREGMTAGEAWARATGTTAAGLHMVPVVKGTHEYKAGHRVGVAKVRNERHNAETSQ